jgi:hypothetical protein
MAVIRRPTHPDPLPFREGIFWRLSPEARRCARSELAARHHFARRRHLRVELGLRHAQFDPVRCLGDGQDLRDRGTKTREQVLGQHDAGRIADLGDFELAVHTRVMTPRGSPHEFLA